MDAKNLVKTMFLFGTSWMLKKMLTGKLKSKHTHSLENEDGTEGDLQPIPEDSDAEWDMIEEVFNSFIGRKLKIIQCLGKENDLLKRD